MKISFIIQARAASSRLPNKILLPFYCGKSILEILIEKLKEVNGAEIVVATSIHSDCDPIERISSSLGVNCYRGDENDVLQRFIDAAESFRTEHIIRVCSDNPFLELNSIRTLVEYIKATEEKVDYVSFKVNGKPSIKTHYGFWTEFVTLEALKRIRQYTNQELYHEHVTNYIYDHPELFRIKWLPTSDTLSKNPSIRLTIDTPADFENVQQIYSMLCVKKNYPTIEDIVTFLNSNREFYQVMNEQIVRNEK